MQEKQNLKEIKSDKIISVSQILELEHKLKEDEVARVAQLWDQSEKAYIAFKNVYTPACVRTVIADICKEAEKATHAYSVAYAKEGKIPELYRNPGAEKNPDCPERILLPEISALMNGNNLILSAEDNPCPGRYPSLTYGGLNAWDQRKMIPRINGWKVDIVPPAKKGNNWMVYLVRGSEIKEISR